MFLVSRKRDKSMYLLDTDSVSESNKTRPNQVFIRNLRFQRVQDLYISSITIMELRYGAMKRHDSQEFWRGIQEEIISYYSILDFGPHEASLTSDIVLALEKRGEPIGLED